jgi:hypothetical protein
MQIDVKTLFNLTFEKLIKSEEEALKYQALYLQQVEEIKTLKEEIEKIKKGGCLNE